MDFDHWLKVYNHASVGSDQREEALSIMAGLAANFREWWLAYNRTIVGSRLEKRALVKMARFSTDFGHWLCLYQEAPQGNILKSIALHHLTTLASTAEDAEEENKKGVKLPRWLKVLAICPEGSATEALAVVKVIEELRKDKHHPLRERI